MCRADAINHRSEPVGLTSLGGVSVQEELRPAADQRTGVRRFVVGVVLGLAILQALWIVTVPPFRASDEIDHAYRAASAARGQWWADVPADNGRGNLVRVPADLVEAAQVQCEGLSYTGPDNCRPVPGSRSGDSVLVATAAGAYNPAYYWVVGTVARPFHGATALYVMRITSAGLCLLFLGLAAWALLVGSGSGSVAAGWRGVGLVVALTPVFVFSTVVAAPNGLEMSAAAALWCALLAAPSAADPRTARRLVMVAGLAAVIISTLRMLGPLFVLLTVLLVALFHGRAGLDFVRRTSRPLAVATLAVAVSVGLSAAWILRTGLAQASKDELLDRTWSPSTLILWPLQTIAAFPFRNVPGPAIVYPVVGLLAGALLFLALKHSRGAQRWALVLAVVSALVLPIVLTAVTRQAQGVIWQGRYGLPVAIGFVLMAGVILEQHRPGPSRLTVVLTGALLAVSTAACLLKIVHDELGRSASAGDGAWWAAPSWLLVVGSGVAYATLLSSVMHVRTHKPAEPHVDPT